MNIPEPSMAISKNRNLMSHSPNKAQQGMILCPEPYQALVELEVSFGLRGEWGLTQPDPLLRAPNQSLNRAWHDVAYP